jgi:ABC-type Fe3+ transport system substrate-binding protein
MVDFEAKGAPLDTQMLEPVPSTVSTIQLAKTPPHPFAAMLFIDFMLSKGGQEVLRDAQYLPPSPAVDPDPSLKKIVPRLSNLQEIVLTPEIEFAGRAEANALYDKYFR